MDLKERLMGLSQQYYGRAIAAPTAIKGDASDRKIFRFVEGDARWMGVTNRNIVENEAFFYFSRHFLEKGIPVPQIYAIDSEKECYLLEDLGDHTLADCLEGWNRAVPPDIQSIRDAYRQVLCQLVRLQFEGIQELDASFCFRDVALDRSVFQWDVNYFKQYFVQIFAKGWKEEALVSDLDCLVRQLDGVERRAVATRDFQSRNIMWQSNAPVFIDYQMACRGALHYDLASLLYASSAGIGKSLRLELIDLYLEEIQAYLPLSPSDFLKDFYHFVLMRRLRSLGSYGFLASQKGKLHFLKSIPSTIVELYTLLTEEPALQGYENLRILFTQAVEDPKLSSYAVLLQQLELSSSTS